jgi:8-oxo-dGTP pyrophosphatase MutT (NUDIX family)
VDIGVAPYKIATAVKGVLGQRLLRRLCECGTNRHRREHLQVAEPAPSPCAACAGEGYRGRLAIVEVLIVAPDFERAVAAGQSAERLGEAARQGGMRSLWESGLEHVAHGHTSRAELLRVAAPPATAVDSSGGTGYLPQDLRRADGMSDSTQVTIKVATVDVYVIRPLGEWRVLVLKRGTHTRCPGSWEAVHGRIEEGERPERAAVREVLEETGLPVARLYNITVQPFYLHAQGIVNVAVVFAAFVDEPAEVRLGEEHDAFEWLSPADAKERFIWPRSKAVLRDIVSLLGTGDAGPVEDVLRVL